MQNRRGRPPQGWQNLTGWRRWVALALSLLALALGAKYQQKSGPVGGGGNSPAHGELRGYARVIDGDSLHVGDAEVRLKGIDAPEGRQTCTRNGQDWACGDASRRALQQLVAGKTVVCDVVERDKHGRSLAFCKAGEIEVNRALVSGGHALSYGSFTSEEAEAKRERRGLWSGEFQRPRDWRHERGIGL